MQCALAAVTHIYVVSIDVICSCGSTLGGEMKVVVAIYSIRRIKLDI